MVETGDSVTPPPGPARPSLQTVRARAALPMLLAFAFIGSVYLLLVTLVVAADPYDIYRWGKRPPLELSDTPRDEVVEWIDVATKNPKINTFLVGSSVTAMYSPSYMRALLGPQAVVYNLSYGGPRPKDRDMILDRLKKNPHVRRVILTFDWMYIRGPTVANRNFPTFLYDNHHMNDMRMVNLEAIDDAIDLLSGDLSYNNPDDRNYARYVRDQYRRFQRPSQMARLQRLIDQRRATIGASSGKTCASFGAIHEQLLPNLRAFSARGVKVDILMPVISYADYYARQTDIGPTMLDEQMIARRCLVLAVAHLPGIRVFALDGNPEIAGDLANFRDPGHVYNPVILRRFVAGIVTGKDQLTAASVDNYVREIRTAVQHYRVRNSHLASLGTRSLPDI
ncbi:hypothetical protein [Sphingobium aquiterrae]|uniref:hypothetical protein n=1 Tax=Sphingobium aquiterrae TaxID=2038656 RepID=UPI0030166C62